MGAKTGRDHPKGTGAEQCYATSTHLCRRCVSEHELSIGITNAVEPGDHLTSGGKRVREGVGGVSRTALVRPHRPQVFSEPR